MLTLLIETPPADGEDAALTQEQVDEAKKALTPEPDPVVDEETPAGGDAEAPEDGDAEAPVDGDAEAPEDGDAAVEPEPAPEPEPVPEPTSDAILAHLIEAGTVTDEAIMKVLTPTMPEPTADELLNHLLENEVIDGREGCQGGSSPRRSRRRRRRRQKGKLPRKRRRRRQRGESCRGRGGECCRCGRGSGGTAGWSG